MGNETFINNVIPGGRMGNNEPNLREIIEEAKGGYWCTHITGRHIPGIDIGYQYLRPGSVQFGHHLRNLDVADGRRVLYSIVPDDQWIRVRGWILAEEPFSPDASLPNIGISVVDFAARDSPDLPLIPVGERTLPATGRVLPTTIAVFQFISTNDYSSIESAIRAEIRKEGLNAENFDLTFDHHQK